MFYQTGMWASLGLALACSVLLVGLLFRYRKRLGQIARYSEMAGPAAMQISGIC